MNKAQTIKGPSCLTKAADDEPLFTLRANDPDAAWLVRCWAEAYVKRKGGMARMTKQQLFKYNDAQWVAADMDHWRRVKGQA